MKSKTLAAKAVLTVVLVCIGGTSLPSRAGIPVIDGANLTQNVISAYEEVAQTLKQIEEYRTQLQQYEDQIKNTLAPAVYLWDEAQATIGGILEAVDTLKYYKRKLGSIDSYLGKFQDVSYYRNSPCFTARGCSPAEAEALAAVRVLASESQKKANEALFRGLDQQQANMNLDAAKLKLLQAGAQGAKGRMEAIGFANQLASQQANQLLQIRGLLVAQQNVIATKMQADQDKEAQQTAADEQFKRGTLTKSSGRRW